MKQTVKPFFRKGDLILYIFIIVITLIPFIFPVFNHSIFNSKKADPEFVEINYKGNVNRYDINEDRVIELKNGAIIIEIKDKKVRIRQSDCHDKLCVKKGWISKIGEFIICMPNKLEVKLTGEEIYDSITW